MNIFNVVVFSFIFIASGFSQFTSTITTFEKWQVCHGQGIPRSEQGSPWGKWSPCNATACGIGYTTRSKLNGTKYTFDGRTCLATIWLTQETQCLANPDICLLNTALSNVCPIAGYSEMSRSTTGFPTTVDVEKNTTELCVADMTFWLQWSNWASWSATCASAYRYRKRRCVYRRTQLPNAECIGSPNEFELATETDIPEYCGSSDAIQPIEYPFAEWTTWSSFDACTQNCTANGNSGYHLRTRSCLASSRRLTCTGASVEKVPCEGVRDCEELLWSTWKEWSPCPVSCGVGIRYRQRVCLGAQCTTTAHSFETETCSTNQICPSSWGLWDYWSRCPDSSSSPNLCVRGIRYRSRVCNNQLSNLKLLIPPSIRRLDETFIQETTVRGPSEVPGQTLAQVAESSHCDGQSVQTDLCPLDATLLANCQPAARDLNPFRQDGVWSSWDGWGSCDQSCGSGHKYRGRRCNSPSPSCGGNECIGSGHDVTPCYLGGCCQFAIGGWCVVHG